MKEQMKELYVEGLASHDGPWHAAVIARSRSKRCRWVRAGEVLSLETLLRTKGAWHPIVAPHRWNNQSLPVFHPRAAPAESSSTPPINVPIVRRQPESTVVRLRLSLIHPLAVAGPHVWGLTVPRTWPWVNHGG